MRTRIKIFCVLVIAAIFLLLWFRHAAKRETPMQAEAMLANQPEQPKVVEHRQITNTSPMLSLPESASPLAKAVAVTNPIAAHILAAWQAPIEFYGKVVDENTNPVTGVDIHFNWSELPERGGERTSDTQSDSDGLFSLHGKRGAALTVSFSKQGYYSSGRGEQTFSYAFPKAISPDPQNPVVFHLRKKGQGESLIQTDFPPGMQIAQLHHDGTPIELDLLNGTRVSAGSGQLELELWRDISNMKAARFDWKLRLSAPNGGLVSTDEEFAFQAPESGYQPSVVIEMPATNQVWFNEVRNKYYIKLPDGKCGRIDFYLLAHNGVFSVHSVINPSGLRSLEPQ